MSQSRKDRLRKVLTLQEKLKRLHETRHAMLLSGAVAAEREAGEIMQRIGAEGSLSEVFPEIYHRRIARANQQRLEILSHARTEADRLAQANARTDIVERNYREALRKDERQRGEKEQLENVERRAIPRK
jgi:hypothetical protein